MRTSTSLIATFAIALFAGCASGHNSTGDDDAAIDGPAGSIDAPPPHIDAMPINETPDAMMHPPPDADVPPDSMVACTPVTQQLLGNGGFDTACGGALPSRCPSWLEYPQDTLYPPIVTAAEMPALLQPQSGGGAVWLGGLYSSTDYMYQQFAIPAGATSMQITAYKWFVTGESPNTAVHDTMAVQIRNTADTLLETVVTYSNLNADNAWTPITLNPTGNYAGQTIRLRFTSTCDADPTPADTTDSVGNTNFFLDTSTLSVLACP